MLNQSIQAEQLANQELQRVHELREKIIRHIGHDLRQPINALSYSLFNIDERNFSATQKDKMSIVNQSVDTANYLIDEILQISTYRKTELTVNREVFVIGVLLLAVKRE